MSGTGDVTKNKPGEPNGKKQAKGLEVDSLGPSLKPGSGHHVPAGPPGLTRLPMARGEGDGPVLSVYLPGQTEDPMYVREGTNILRVGYKCIQLCNVAT